ncbi:hypothetical protein Tco_1008797 [Tanacetum coccineum]
MAGHTDKSITTFPTDLRRRSGSDQFKVGAGDGPTGRVGRRGELARKSWEKFFEFTPSFSYTFDKDPARLLLLQYTDELCVSTLEGNSILAQPMLDRKDFLIRIRIRVGKKDKPRRNPSGNRSWPTK